MSVTEPSPDDCFICRKHRGEISIPGGAIYEDDRLYVGHVRIPEGQDTAYLGWIVVETKRHVPEIGDLTDEEARAMGLMITRAGRALVQSESAEHVYVFLFGHGVPHVHMHVIARYPGAPREYWGAKVDEWPDAPHGGADEIAALCARLRAAFQSEDVPEATEMPLEPDEPPTTISLITVSAGGFAKRTPRHLYSRQRRGGMGVFDLDAPEGDRPAFLTLADENDSLILITNLARAFRLHVNGLPESPVRDRGQSLMADLPLMRDERLAAILPARASGYLAVLSWRGFVRCLRYNFVGENMAPGTALYEVKEFGAPIAACWTPGDADLFIATRKGNAIRFSERHVPVAGCPGIRLDADDAAVGVASVRAESGVFLLGADGKGTIRLMAGFAPNKAPGGGGKLAMKTDRLVAALTAGATEDVFIISRLGKIIRFRADEVPAKEGVVQGVNCIALRADDAVAVASSPMAQAVYD